MKLNEVFAKKTYRSRHPETIDYLKQLRKQTKGDDSKAITKEITKARSKHLQAAPGLEIVKAIVTEWKKMARADKELYRNSAGTKVRRSGYSIGSYGYAKLNIHPIDLFADYHNSYMDAAIKILSRHGYQNPEHFEMGGGDHVRYTYYDDDEVALVTLDGTAISDRDFYTDKKVKKHKYILSIIINDNFKDHPDLTWK